MQLFLKVVVADKKIVIAAIQIIKLGSKGLYNLIYHFSKLLNTVFYIISSILVGLFIAKT